MRKIILIMFGIMFWMPAHATTMCAINDAIAVVLDPTISSTGYSADTTAETWWVQFPYGRIYGTSACIDTNHGKSRGNTVSKLTDSNSNRVVGNERNGANCWCKITHPVSSVWVFYIEVWPATSCAPNCSYYCSDYVRTNGAARATLFGSVS